MIIGLTYIGIAVGRLPQVHMNRTTIVLSGAALLVAIGAVSEEEALGTLDSGTILLLGAMMIINNNLRLAGFFDWIAVHVLRLARGPRSLLAMLILSSGILSALFLNDTICVMFTPLVVDMTLRLKRNAIPYLIALASATNIGSVATITGNPQNLIIGQSSGISYLTFASYLVPVALIGLVLCWIIVVINFADEFRGGFEIPPQASPQIFRPLLIRTLSVVAGLLVAFLVGLPIVSSACIAAGLLLISRQEPDKMLDIDWNLLAFFAGLFVVTGTIELTGISADVFGALSPIFQGGLVAFSIGTAALSNVVSNVPAVLLLRTEVVQMPLVERGWLTLAMASTLAGNLTLLGSAANLIVAEIARKQGVHLGFNQYLKVGVPLTFFTLAIGSLWLMVMYP